MHRHGTYTAETCLAFAGLDAPYGDVFDAGRSLPDCGVAQYGM